MTDITTPKPADLISSLRLLEPKRMAAFRQAAAPLTADPKALPKKCGQAETAEDCRRIQGMRIDGRAGPHSRQSARAPERASMNLPLVGCQNRRWGVGFSLALG
jgi:hypothetical protein